VEAGDEESTSAYFPPATSHADGLSFFQRAAAHEHPQPAEQHLLAWIQQVVAPVDCIRRVCWRTVDRVGRRSAAGAGIPNVPAAPRVGRA